jgi:hypothetical protein
MIDSAGNWHIYGGEIWQNVYTKTETDALLDDKQDELNAAQLAAVNSGITAAKLATLQLALGTKIYGIRIDKQDANPDTRVTYLYDAVGMTPAYMDFVGGSFNYGS